MRTREQSPEQRQTISELCYSFSEQSVPGVPLDTAYALLPSTSAMPCAGSVQAAAQQTQRLALKPASGMPAAVITAPQLWSALAART